MAAKHVKGAIALSSPEHVQQNPDSQPPESKDPAEIAVALLIDRALQAACTTMQDAGADAAITIFTVVEAAWSKLACDDWRQRTRAGKCADLVGEQAWGGRGAWICWAPGERPRQSELSAVYETFALAVCEGRHSVAFVGDPSWLPDDVRRAADFSLILPPLSGHDISIVAQRLTGREPNVMLTDEQAGHLTPGLMRWARRPSQTADAYIEKLSNLLKQPDSQEAEAKNSSPREHPTLDRLHGMDEAVAWGQDVARDLALFRRGDILWRDVDCGCLLSGPPGCGKTLYARALATTCRAALITGSYGQWLGTGGGHQGELLKGIRKTFAEARAKAPAVLFIDEVDSFPNRSTVAHNYADWEIQVVNALLAEIDGVEGRTGVILLAACNHPEKLDPALIRSGRLDRHIQIGLPDGRALVRIFQEHLGDDLRGEDLTGASLAADGASGADCERMVRGARRRARSAKRPMVMADLMEEIATTDHRSSDDLWLTAVHEAGHAVLANLLFPGCLKLITIQARGSLGGRTSASRPLRLFKRSADIKVELMLMLAGRAAEEEVLGVVSSGSGGAAISDLAQATGLAVEALLCLGLDDKGDLLWGGSVDARELRSLLTLDKALAERARCKLDDAYSEAICLVRQQKSSIVALAVDLLKFRVVDGAAAERIISGRPK